MQLFFPFLRLRFKAQLLAAATSVLNHHLTAQCVTVHVCDGMRFGAPVLVGSAVRCWSPVKLERTGKSCVHDCLAERHVYHEVFVLTVHAEDNFSG